MKQTYRAFGTYLAEGLPGDTSSVPLLSLPETTPAVVRLVPRHARLVLDAGCGPRPAAAIALANRGHHVVALDIGYGMVALARRVAADMDARIIGVVADVERLPFRPGAVDAVVCDDTIEHLPDDHRGAAELAAVTKPAGIVVVATPNRHGLVVLWRKVRDRARGRRLPPEAYYAASSHLREYTRRELADLLSSSMIVTESSTVGFGTTTTRERIASLAVRARPLSRFGRMIILAAHPR